MYNPSIPGHSTESVLHLQTSSFHISEQFLVLQSNTSGPHRRKSAELQHQQEFMSTADAADTEDDLIPCLSLFAEHLCLACLVLLSCIP